MVSVDVNYVVHRLEERFGSQFPQLRSELFRRLVKENLEEPSAEITLRGEIVKPPDERFNEIREFLVDVLGAPPALIRAVMASLERIEEEL